MLNSDIFAGLVLVQAPTVEPIDLDSAKTHLRVSSTFNDDDQYIGTLITVARQLCESILHRALLTQMWRLSLKNWPGRDLQNWPVAFSSALDQYYRFNHIELPLPPLQGVTSVQFQDSSGNVFTMPQGLSGAPAGGSPPWGSGNANISGGYNVFTDMEPGRIVLPYSQIWPTNILLPGAPIQIVFTAGYLDVPTLMAQFEGYAATIQAILLIISYCYENRLPPAEMRKGFSAAGTDMVVEQLLEPYRVFA